MTEMCLAPQGAIPVRKIGEGKTKKVWGIDNRHVILEQKPDVTRFNDPNQTIIVPGKDVFANTATCRIFEAIRFADPEIPLAYMTQFGDSAFMAKACIMAPFEVVITKVVHPRSSFLKRNPSHTAWKALDEPSVDFFLKTEGRKWGEHDLPVDDPLLIVNKEAGTADLYLPTKPVADQKPFLQISLDTLKGIEHLDAMREAAKKIGVILASLWAGVDHLFVDVKLEFGFDAEGRMWLADVIDADSGRTVNANRENIDKQRFRDGEETPMHIWDLYRYFAELTEKFPIKT